MRTERANTYNFYIALQNVYNHRQFINPVLAQKLSDGCYAKIVFELSTLVKVVLFIYILLKIFGVGIHGAHFIYINQLAVLSSSKHFKNYAVRGDVVNK